MESRSVSWSCAGWALLAVACGLVWRLGDVGSALLFGDEFHSLRLAQGDLVGVLSVFEPNGSGMALPFLQHLSLGLAGGNHWSLRAAAWVPSVLLLLLFYPLARRMIGNAAAAIAVGLLATNSFLVFYAHFGRAYSLVALLAFLLLFLAQRAIDRGTLTGWQALAAFLLFALLPWVHLSSLLFVLPVGAATGVALWLGPGRSQAAPRFALAMIGGLLGALALHAWAWRSLWRFLNSKLEVVYPGSVGVLDVGTLLVGSRAGALTLLVISLGAWTVVVYRGGLRAWPLAAGVAGAPLGLAIVQPFGDAYAYARYLVACLPAVFLLCGWGIAEAGKRLLPGTPRMELSALAVGVALAAALFLRGPGTPGGPHANTYMGLLPLPAFDLAWEGAPRFYHDLANNPRPVRIIEVPALTDRARHLYRNYHRLHGKPTSLGMLPSELWDAPEGPYVSMREGPNALADKGDFLVLHHNLDREAARYWGFVYRENPGLSEDPSVASFMRRHQRLQRSRNDLPPNLEAQLRQALGPPLYADDEIWVWRLRG